MTGDRLVVGRIAKAHGIKGEVAVEVHSDAPGRFDPGASVRADPDLTLTVKAARPHQGRLLVTFEEVPDRNGAEALRGRWLSVGAGSPAHEDPWSFWEHELDQAEVFDVSGARLGTFARAEHGRGGDLWVVRTGKGDVLVPAVKEFVREVDVAARRIVLDPPEGLF